MTDAPENPQPAAEPTAPQPPAAAPSRLSRAAKIAISVGSALLVVVVGVVVSFAVRAALSGPSKQQVIEKGVEEALAVYSPPQDVDEVTTITAIEAEQDAIHYSYSLHGVDPSLVDAETLESIVLPGLCSTKETRNILDHDIRMKYTYVVEETGDTYELDFSDDDC